MRFAIVGILDGILSGQDWQKSGPDIRMKSPTYICILQQHSIPFIMKR